MKVNILGAGGVGGYYGALLARHGCQVTFIARGPHLEAIRRDGLFVRSVHGDFHLQPARATDDAAEAGVADLVLVCNKTTTNHSALALLPNLVAEHTTVLSLQNGIDAVEQIGAVIGMQPLLAGTTWLSAAIEAPGVIRQFSQFRRLVAGELDGRITPRLQALASAFQPTGVTFETSTEIEKVLWTKFLFIAAVSAVGALTRLPVGAYRQVPECRALLASLMGEVQAVAHALAIPLPADVIPQTLAFVDQNAPGSKPSMQKDVEAGRPFELETIIGVIGRKGRACGVPTPCTDLVYAALKPLFLAAAT